MQVVQTSPAPPPPPLRATRFLTDADVGSLADWPAAIQALAAAYAQPIDPACVPPRAMARGDGIWLRSLTAVVPGGYLGCKLISASPRAARASYLIALFDAGTMALAGLIDGNQITGLRTAATATVAVDHLAPRRALRVAVLGSGFEARAQLHALAAQRAIASVAVYSPNPASREAFAALFEHRGWPVQAAAQPQDAVQGADVVLCAARARGEQPILRAGWLAPGATVVSIGSTLPEQRELDVDVLARAHSIVADMPDEVLHDTGDLIAAQAAGLSLAPRLVALSRLVGGKAVARAEPGDIAVYKSVGSALQDVVLAGMLLDRALARGVGTDLPVSIAPVAK
ncbi:ornithine cyclodeaminase family protein [Variovorax terrae]|uniref:Ornithine cyclodeaminase family protein n=1 Tax=Variovorax terrae TaxID=2923278 RepID=A0A9X1VYD2_9BURK|nr:ornithine cyclodeaminase family protein [Variovorax terrae]MCJ0765553.1 ornithine cyclodeaminase family protein [Variovorax terrae]